MTHEDQRPVPDDDALADRLHGAAGGIAGAGVTRGGVAAVAAARTKTAHRRRLAASSIAAAVVLVAGAVLASGRPLGDQVRSVDHQPKPIHVRPDGQGRCPVGYRLVDRTGPRTFAAASATVVGRISRGLVLDLLAAVGPDQDSGFSQGQAAWLSGARYDQLDTVTRRFVAVLKSLSAARITAVRVLGAEALTSEQREAIAAYEARLPSAAQVESWDRLSAREANRAKPGSYICTKDTPRTRVSLPADIGRLNIPKIGVNVTVRGYDLSAKPGAGPYHVDDTALPGQIGQASVRDSRSDGDRSLRRIDELTVGDLIGFIGPDGTHVFQVDFLRSGVKATEEDRVLLSINEGDTARLALSTDDPAHLEQGRFVVSAIERQPIIGAPQATTTTRVPHNPSD